MVLAARIGTGSLGRSHRYVPPHRTMLVDLLGFGNSPKPWCRYRVHRHLDALDAALTGHRHMTLVGHSLGAVLAVAYAARHPAVVCRLVMLGLPYFGNHANSLPRYDSRA